MQGGREYTGSSPHQLHLVSISDCSQSAFFSRLSPLHVFPRLTAFGTSCMFSRAWHRLHVFPCLASATCFPALGIGYMFSRAWHRLHVFPRLTPVACFPAFDIGCMFSRPWHRLHVFPRLAPVACFPAFDTGCMFSLA